MKALSVRQPHAEAIMRGVKKIEYRTVPTKRRERIYIYASKTRYKDVEETELMEDYGLNDKKCEQLPRGVLVGTVEIVSCQLGEDEYYHWHLDEPHELKRYRKPTGRPQPVWFEPFPRD